MEPEEVLEEVVETPAQPEAEPMTIYTKGKWEKLEDFMQQEFEDGKTYHIKVKGRCKFAVSKDEPSAGIATNEITFTKEPETQLWIKTGA